MSKHPIRNQTMTISSRLDCLHFRLDVQERRLVQEWLGRGREGYGSVSLLKNPKFDWPKLLRPIRNIGPMGFHSNRIR